MFDPKAKNNFSSMLGHLEASSASLQTLLNSQTGALAQSLKNVSAFTGNLAKNNEQVDKTLANVEKATNKLANAKIDETLETVNASMTELKATVAKMNSSNGSLGLLLNDKKLYNNLEGSSRSLNTLLDDVRVHPKRYVSISVFGKKDKTGPLSAPVSDSVSKANK
jgi:phospholipid/cholesterol/gamma-HCH transport system substrate-binding protein